MRLIELSASEHLYNLVFEKELENSRREITVSFTIKWEFSVRWIVEKFAKTQNELRNTLMFINIHIPNEDDRELFKQCILYYARESFAPVSVEPMRETSRHPGYPLITLCFDSTVLNKDEVSYFARTIMEAVVKAETNDYPYPKLSEDSVDDEVTDEDNIIEYEEDDELKELMHKPVKTEIISLDDGELND